MSINDQLSDACKRLEQAINSRSKNEQAINSRSKNEQAINSRSKNEQSIKSSVTRLEKKGRTMYVKRSN